jgi:hypothetical protein
MRTNEQPWTFRCVHPRLVFVEKTACPANVRLGTAAAFSWKRSPNGHAAKTKISKP